MTGLSIAVFVLLFGLWAFFAFVIGRQINRIRVTNGGTFVWNCAAAVMWMTQAVVFYYALAIPLGVAMALNNFPG
jgi:hypothetical protein